MNWRNIKTVWFRELRDQLRDRRTLFMVAVLPLLMYPIMGMSFFQLAQFMRDKTARVLVVGAEQLTDVPGLPELIDGDHFAPGLFASPDQARKLEVLSHDAEAEGADLALSDTRGRLGAGELDAVVVFPADFVERLSELRAQLEAFAAGGGQRGAAPSAPKPLVLFNSSRDASQVAHLRVERLLNTWRQQIVGKNLDETRVPAGVLKPFQLSSEDIAEPAARRAGIWSKLLPFVVFVWALTGAFYPAVDLCAGEKERGTLETLLASPASRSDIVWGKLLTVITFSMITAVLNLLGIGFTGGFISQQLAAAGPLAGGLGAPPLTSLVWLLVALPPVSALFSALSFACASFARSTKEGQYYFMPLFLATMPLMLMPLSPGVELNLGNSLAPVMGLALLLRSLMEGDFLEAVRYALPVTVVTFGCCLLATRWAVAQFNQESVLFRGDERFDLRLWLKSVLRRRDGTPTVSMAVGCVAMILLLQFVVRSIQPRLLPPPGELGFRHFVAIVLVSQVCVLAPGLLMGGWLTTNTRRTFLLRGVSSPQQVTFTALAGLLAIAVHPLGLQISLWIQELYPLSEEIQRQAGAMSGLLADAGSPLAVVCLIGFLPAFVEELTFRGAILSGLRSTGSSFWPVVITAIAFGAVHTVFQQSLSAAVLGLLIGYLAVVTRSLWPCIAFHAVYNSLPALISYYANPLENWLDSQHWTASLVRLDGEKLVGYQPAVVLTATAVAGLLLWCIREASAAQADRPDALPRPNPRDQPPGPLTAGLVSSESTEG
ncbi:MAG: ABC transporter permease subunit/CPBP intramembrane protease [Planctomycetota bacterium]